MGVLQQLTFNLIVVLFMSLLWIASPGLSLSMVDTNAYGGAWGRLRPHRITGGVGPHFGHRWGRPRPVSPKKQ